MLEGETEANRERFTSRLEAFSDLVFGFSLSLLATRLGVPARPEDIFEKTRWLAIIVTFALVCRFWLEHYRIFRHRFVAGMFDATLNFVFLFGIAVLPYAVECFLRFRLVFASFALYVGDFALILVTLAALRVRSLQQRRSDPALEDRLRAWQRSLIQFAIALLLGLFLVAINARGGSFESGMAALGHYEVIAVVVVIVGIRRLIRRLPAFLR